MSTIPASGVLMLWYHLETLLDWYWIVLFSFVCFANFRIMWPAQVYFDDDVSCISYTRYYWFLGMPYFFFWCPNLTYICCFLFWSLRPTLGIVEQTPGEIYRTLWWCQRLWSHPFRAHQALTIKLDKWASHCILFATLPWLEGTCSNKLSCDIWSFPALCHCVFVFLVAGCSQLSCFKFITNQGRWIVAGQDCKPFLLVLQAKRQEFVKKEKKKWGCEKETTHWWCAPLSDLPNHLDIDEGTNHRREKLEDDTFVLVKEYISSTELRQPPLLVLTAEHRATYSLTTNRNLALLFAKFLSINIDYPWLLFVWNLSMFLQQSITKVIGLQPSAGEISRRALKSDVTHGWLKLAGIFEQLLGGSEATRRAAVYLRGLARDELPIHPLHPLNWHENVNFLADLIPHEKAEPHACVLAVLCPSVPLRVVWKRGLRWFLRIG